MRPRHTPAFIASFGNRYENGDEPIAQVAAEYEISERTANRWVVKYGWKRRSERPPRDLPEPLRLLDAATALEAQAAAAPAATGAHPPAAGEGHAAGEPSRTRGSSPGQALLATIERIERQLHAHLAAEEGRAHARGAPATRAESAKAAQTLATLTQTLQKLAALRRGESGSQEADHDEFPADIDERRRTIARRIHAFVDSRIGGGVDGASRPLDAERDRA